jgi:uncharacterized tellurite resistance protein B-like protein
MLDAIRRLFAEREARQAEPTTAAPEHALRLAAAALVFEIVRADGAIKEEEVTVMRTALQGTFGLTAAEARDLAKEAEQASREAVSLYEFTRVVDQGLGAEEKKRIVELLWLVAFADAEKHPLEEHLVRKVAGLLHVAHPDFIDAKIRARAESDLRAPRG